ncbi:MAG: hypothetical protein FWF12_00630 [Betaproteobacteria bacterium]|nr:hypothetical protein [Betaproteobacteria bacterium]
MEKFNDTEIYPVEASESGNNAYHIPGCEHVGHQPAYAACLKRVAERKNGRLAVQHAECSAAIGKKECCAAKMRKEELVEGRAIYFINRKKQRAFYQYQEEMSQPKLAALLAGDVKPSKTGKRDRRPAPQPANAEPIRPQHFLDLAAGSYADAINRAAQVPMPIVAQPEPTPAITLVSQPKSAPVAAITAGMSLLEMARLQMAAKLQPTE